MKMALKHKNDEFLCHASQRCTKHKNGHKNDELLVMPLKHVLSVMDLVNHHDTPKLWAITHKMAINAKQ
jgi:hypothetical protein